VPALDVPPQLIESPGLGLNTGLDQLTVTVSASADVENASAATATHLAVDFIILPPGCLRGPSSKH